MNNPTTTVFSRKELEGMVEFVCRYDLMLVVDQAFEDSIFDGIEVDIVCKALKNAFAGTGVMAGEAVVTDPKVYIGGNVLFAQRGGLHFINIKSGDLVKKGQELGYTIDWSGEVVHRDICPCDGLMTNMVVHGGVNPGDMLFVIADEAK